MGDRQLHTRRAPTLRSKLQENLIIAQICVDACVSSNFISECIISIERHLGVIIQILLCTFHSKEMVR
jgi:hypothetical protein